jgi:hypothetical protein
MSEGSAHCSAAAWSVPVVRADFTNDIAWEHIKEEISESTREGFGADVEFVRDRALADLDEAAITASYRRAYPYEYQHPVVVDRVAVSRPNPSHPGPQSQRRGRCWPVPGHAPVRCRGFRTICRWPTSTSANSCERAAPMPSSAGSDAIACSRI